MTGPTRHHHGNTRGEHTNRPDAAWLFDGQRSGGVWCAVAMLVLACTAPRVTLAEDCNRNNVPDVADISTATSTDCNVNDKPDECDVPHAAFATTGQLPPAFACGGALAPGDFDGDGDNDLVAIGLSFGFVQLKNNGDGTFAEPVAFGPAIRAPGIFSVDLDSDAAPDIIAFGGDPKLTVIWNTPGDGLSLISTVPLDHAPSAVTAADLNGDGKPDVAVSHTDWNVVSIRLRTEEGGFTVPANVEVAGGPGSIAAGDLDSDGDLDLAVVNVNSDTVAILWNDGEGSVTDVTYLPANLHEYHSSGTLALVDLDGDGDVDVVVAGYRPRFGVIENLGGRFFGAPVMIPLGITPYVLAVADVDGDAVPDVISTGHNGDDAIAFVRGIGNREFNSPILYTADYPTSLVVSDFDGAGTLDVATIGWGDPVTVARNLGGPAVALPVSLLAGTGSAKVALGDIDQDGDLDVAIASDESNDVWVYRNQGGDLFEAVGAYAVGRTPVVVSIGDLNGDGFPEVITANRLSSDLSILVNNGDGTFADRVTRVDVITSPSDVAVGDFTGDGNVDLATARLDSRGIMLLRGSGDGTFTAVSNVPLDMYPYRLAAADLDLDGDLDLIVAGETVQAWLNDGSGQFTRRWRFRMTSSPGGLVVDDLDGDGRPDVAVVSSVLDDVIAVAKGTGDGTFGSPMLLVFDTVYSKLASGDVDGDGDRDLIATGGGGVSVFPNRGDGSFAAPVTMPLDDAPESLVTGDFDSNGRIDIVFGVHSGVRNAARLVRNVAASSVSQDCSNDGIPDECQADVDADGVPDICDQCPSDPRKSARGICGCGVADSDGNGDGTMDCLQCPGDCNRDQKVTVDELIAATNVALGNAPPSTCANADPDGNGVVTIAEIITAVRSALWGCGA